MPLTFEALKGQRYRWCFGGIQILRMHWRSLLPGRGTKANHLSIAQRWSYLAGGIQWYGDLLGLVFFVFLLAGAFNLATGGGELFRKLTIFLVAAVPVMVGLGLVRAVTLLRRGTGASWRDAIGAFFIWQSTSVVVARASVLGLFAKQGGVPADAEDQRARQVVGGAAGELGRVVAGRARPGRRRRRADQVEPAQRAAAGGAAAVPDPGLSRRRRSTAGPRSAPPCRRGCVSAGGPRTAGTGGPSRRARPPAARSSWPAWSWPRPRCCSGRAASRCSRPTSWAPPRARRRRRPARSRRTARRLPRPRRPPPPRPRRRRCHPARRSPPPSPPPPPRHPRPRRRPRRRWRRPLPPPADARLDTPSRCSPRAGDAGRRPIFLNL